MELAAHVCGVPADTLEKVAHMIAEAEGVCVLWAMGVTQHVAGSDTSTAISNLLLITGNYMQPGRGAYPLRGHNNVQGASDHGAMPNFLPGYQSVDDSEVRARFEAAWRVTLPSSKGLDNHEMVEAIHEGKLKAMYLFGEEMSLVDSNANYVGDAFSKLDFFVVQEIFFSDTCRYRRRDIASQPQPGKRRHVHEHRETNPEALSGVRAIEGKPPRLADRAGRCQSSRGRMELPASFRDLSTKSLR